MWYQFNEKGECVSSASAKVAPIDGITSVRCDTVYYDIQNLRLIDGEVVYIKKEEK